MLSLKINKITAIWILMVLIIAYSQATPPKLIKSELPLQRNIEEEMHLVGGYPKVGEIFEVVYRIRIIDTADWTYKENYLTKDYCAIIHAQPDATEMIGENIFFFSGLKLGEKKEFRARCRIVKPWNWIQVTGHIALGRKGDVRGAVSAKGGIPLYLIDPKTGQYGSKIVTTSNIHAQGLTVTGPNIPPGIPTPEGVMTWINLKLTLPSMPQVDEVFNVEFTISCINDLENTKFGPDYTVTFSSNTATILTGKEYKYSGYMKKGEVKKFAAKMVINKAEPSVSIKGIITGDKRGWPPQDIGFVIFLVDEETGQYGTNEEYNRQLYKTSPQWFYDAAGEFTNEGVSPDAAAENLKIIARIKQLNPNLTDWEALYLHYDGIQALMGGMGDGKTTWEDRWRFLLDMGWLEKQRQGKEIKDKWLKEIIEKYKGKPLTKEQGFNPIFFCGGSNNIVNNNSSLDSTKTMRRSYSYEPITQNIN